MKKSLMFILIFFMAIPILQAADNTKNIKQSKVVIKEFAQQLKGELKKAMKAGGPISAIEVCNKTAPAIATAMSKKYDMQVRRTSLKLRNPINAPDAWEKAVLEKFEQRQAAGEQPGKMAYSEVVEEDGKKYFRFMKAIGMPPLKKMPCLKCHGENIAPPIAKKLSSLYPNDQARGYKAGQIRGAFSIKKAL